MQHFRMNKETARITETFNIILSKHARLDCIPCALVRFYLSVMENLQDILMKRN